MTECYEPASIEITQHRYFAKKKEKRKLSQFQHCAHCIRESRHDVKCRTMSKLNFSRTIKIQVTVCARLKIGFRSFKEKDFEV